MKLLFIFTAAIWFLNQLTKNNSRVVNYNSSPCGSFDNSNTLEDCKKRYSCDW